VRMLMTQFLTVGLGTIQMAKPKAIITTYRETNKR